MENNIFDEIEAQQLVDAILVGYKNYLNMRHRVKKEDDLIQDGGLSWARGNYIDTAFAREGLPFVTEYTKKKAGQSWQYLEFDAQNELGKILLILKNATRFKQTLKKSKNPEKNLYLRPYAEINEPYFQNKTYDEDFFSEQLILDLSEFKEEAVKENLSGYDAFFVIAFEVDPKENIMTSIEVLALHPNAIDFESVQDLSPYIRNSTIEPATEEVRYAFTEEEPDSTNDSRFRYGVPAKENIE
ncbi:spr1630 family ClpXP-sensitive toxin [Lactococcus garvieae]